MKIDEVFKNTYLDTGTNESRDGYDYERASRSRFKRRELDYELRHEDKDNYAVYINGRLWKVVADGERARKMVATLQRKGKKAYYDITKRPVSESQISKHQVSDRSDDMELDEARGDIRKALAAAALIAGLWGVEQHTAQKALDASPQLQKLTAYLEVAKQHNDQRMIDQLEQRIEAHKMRLKLGKGDVLDQRGEPIDVVYDKPMREAKKKISKSEDPCWKGYHMVGTKTKGGKQVPNCVPGKKG